MGTVYFPDEPQVIHGDYHDANLFFDDSKQDREQQAYSVSAIIDWEKDGIKLNAGRE
jgi:Predicted aminoglycoside phosphotransferase